MKKVLIVDDTKNIRMLLSTCLEIEGYEVSNAADGKHALELFNEERYDLAFLDIKMPELSGTEVLRRIRSQGIDTPVIIMTAFPTVKNAVDCTKLGAVAYLQKPFTPEKIKNVMKEVLREEEDELSDIIFKINTCMKEQKYDMSMKLCNKALSHDPENPEVYLTLSHLYDSMGQIEKSQKFKEVYEIMKNNI